MDNMQSQIDQMLSGQSVASNFWNYSNDQKESFMPVIEADVTKISFAQEREYKTHAPKFWDDGKPRVIYIMHFVTPDGRELLLEIKPKSKMMMEDFIPVCPNGNLKDLIGMHVQVAADQPPVVNGQKIPFSQQMRRKFHVTVMGPATNAVEGVDYESYKQLMAQPPQQQPQQQPQAPAPMPMVQQQYMQQQGVQAPQRYQQPVQPMQPQQQAAVVMGQFPGANVTMQGNQLMPSGPDPELYDQDIPF